MYDFIEPEDNIKVVVAGVKLRDVTERTIPNTLEALQEIVDGYIETTSLPDLKEHGIIMIVNEMGLLNGLEPNANLFPWFYVGNIIFTTADEGEFVSLTTEQANFVRNWLYDLDKWNEAENADY